MTDRELIDHLDDLFSGIVPGHGPAPEPGAGAEPAAEAKREKEEKSESLLEDAVVASLLEGRGAAEPVRVEPLALKVPPLTPTETEEGGEDQAVSPASAPSWDVTLGKRRVKVLNILLYGVIILGGAPLAFVLASFMRQESVTWSGFHTLYCVSYTVVAVVTLIQWLFNSSLTRAIQEADDKRVEAVRSQKLLEEQVGELGAASALFQRRSLQLQATVQACQAITSVLDWDELMREVVDQIRDRFNLYYAGLFLIDEAHAGDGREWTVLRAGTGEAGSRMVAQGYKIGPDSISVVGHCVASGQARIALSAAAAYMRSGSGDGATELGEQIVQLDDTVDIVQINPLLPETRSEMALPLLSRGRVIGVLDLHSVEQDAFSEEDAPVLQGMADQVVVALENARAFAEIRARLEELEDRQRELVREQRSRIMPERVAPLYERARPDALLSGDSVPAEVEQAMASREVVAQSNAGDGKGPAALVAPIRLRDQVIGALGLQEAEGERWWSDDEVALIESVADQMALAIENARLLEATRQRAEQERRLAEISANVRASTDVDTILRTAVRELGRALGASDGLIRLGAESLSSEE